MQNTQRSFISKGISFFTTVAFAATSIISPAQAQSTFSLPNPGSMVKTTTDFVPAIMKGLTVDPTNPFHFDFIIDTGDTGLDQTTLAPEADKLVKYFLAALTVPEDQKWVNLSPYEDDRIIPESLGATELGRDMLAQDYMLKQLTASLMYPEDELGKKFWERVYAKAQQMYGTTDIPMNTFNKIWIVPSTATVYEYDQSAFVVERHLKVYLEKDYVALQKNLGTQSFGLDSLQIQDADQVNEVASAVVREVLIPEIEREVNEGQIFANLRQIYNAMILATWYRRALKDSLLGQVYANQNKTAGIEHDDPDAKNKIYNQYVEAFTMGVYDLLKEDYDPVTDQSVVRKYFSGGAEYREEVVGVQEIPVTEEGAQQVSEAMLGIDNAELSKEFRVEINLQDERADQGARFDNAQLNWTDVQGDIDRWLPLAQKVTLEDVNQDMFRDYDYRYVKDGVALKPEVVFILGLAWAKMALEKAQAAGIETRDVLVARDARKIEPEIADALIAALRYAGLNVVFVGDQPNAVTSYSWAVQSQDWLMTIFNTASHVSQPENMIVRGFKVTQLKTAGGNLLSLTTKEIKQQSLSLVRKLLEEGEINEMQAVQPGTLTRQSIEESAIRFNTAVGLAAAGKESLYRLSQDIKEKDANQVVQTVAERLASKPLAGLKVVVEGSHTQSGPIAAGVFENLGAKVEGLNLDVQEIFGLHNADPSIDKNLEALKNKIRETKADFGIAFDLDGDRGAILVPEWNEDQKEVVAWHMLAPDNLLGVLMPSLLKDWGYADSGKKIGVIRDVLGTYGVNDSAKQDGVDMFQTDAGYVYLKAKKEEMEAEGYVFPVYGERSGHTWLGVSGEIENPVAVAVLFSLIVAENKDSEDVNGVLNLYKQLSIPYSQSPRFQPFYHPRLLQWLSDNNSMGWKYEPGKNPPQAIVALGKDETVKRLSRKFVQGETFGDYKVTAFNAYQDPEDEGGLFRFADIMFEKDGQFVGRVVVRASSNDPTFVMSYESPIRDGNIAEANKNRIVTSGLVMQFMIDEGLGIFTQEQMAESMNYLTPENQEKQFNKSNLGPVAADFQQYVSGVVDLAQLGKTREAGNIQIAESYFSDDAVDQPTVDLAQMSPSQPYQKPEVKGLPPLQSRDYEAELDLSAGTVTVTPKNGVGEPEIINLSAEYIAAIGALGEADRIQYVEKIVNNAADLAQLVGVKTLILLMFLNSGFLSEIASKVLSATTQTEASVAAQGNKDSYGGINLNENMLDLNIKRDGKGVILPVTDQPIEQLRQSIPGFKPVIINITPIANMTQYLSALGSAADTADADLPSEGQLSLGPVDRAIKI